MTTNQTSQALSWHQQQALHRAYKTRNLPAHILSNDCFVAICGARRPRVTIDSEHRHNPANKCCQKCQHIADKSSR